MISLLKYNFIIKLYTYVTTKVFPFLFKLEKLDLKFDEKIIAWIILEKKNIYMKGLVLLAVKCIIKHQYFLKCSTGTQITQQTNGIKWEFQNKS